MSEVTTDVIRRVFDDEGHFLEVGPWPDCIKFVELRTVGGKESADWFGQLSISLSPEMALAVGKALIAAASEAMQ